MSVRINGMKELQGKLKQKERSHDKAIQKVVRHHGIKLQQTMTRKAIFTKGYSLGDTQASISLEITHGGFTAMVGPQTHYSPYLEYGTRFMSAQPFVKPSLDVVKPAFIADLNKLVK